MSALPVVAPTSALSIVQDTPPAARENYAGWIMEKLQARLNLIRDRFYSNTGYRRRATKADARAALEYVAEIVASIALEMPLDKSRMLAPVLDALDAIVGPPKC